MNRSISSAAKLKIKGILCLDNYINSSPALKSDLLNFLKKGLNEELENIN